MVAEPQPRQDRFERSVAAIEALLDERGIGRHALFHEVNEGTAFPDGTEAMSGHVVDERGRIYFFWTDWDAERERPRFSTWEEVAAEPAWSSSDEYLDARAAVGLPVPRRSRS